MKNLTKSYENPQVRRTKGIIAAAFFERLEENPYKKIRISDICERAGVSRSTFYNHYEQIEDIPYDHYAYDWLEKLNSILDEYLEQDLPVDEIYTQGGIWILEYWANEVEIYKLLKAAGMEDILAKLFSAATNANLHKFTDGMTITIDPLLYEYYVTLLGVIFFRTYDFWVKSSMKNSAREMTQVMLKFASLQLLEELAESFGS